MTYKRRDVRYARLVQISQYGALLEDEVVEGTPRVLQPHETAGIAIERDVSSRTTPRHSGRVKIRLADEELPHASPMRNREAIPRPLGVERVCEGLADEPKDEALRNVFAGVDITRRVVNVRGLGDGRCIHVFVLVHFRENPFGSRVQSKLRVAEQRHPPEHFAQHIGVLTVVRCRGDDRTRPIPPEEPEPSTYDEQHVEFGAVLVTKDVLGVVNELTANVFACESVCIDELLRSIVVWIVLRVLRFELHGNDLICPVGPSVRRQEGLTEEAGVDFQLGFVALVGTMLRLGKPQFGSKFVNGLDGLDLEPA